MQIASQTEGLIPKYNMQKVLSIGEILNEYLLHSNAPLAAAYRKHVQEMMASNESVDYIKKGERYD